MQFIWKEQEEMEYTKLGQTGKEKAHTIQMRQVWVSIFWLPTIFMLTTKRMKTRKVEIARKYEKTTSQVMLRWHLQSDLVSFAKSVTPARIQENFDIFDFELLAEDMEKISSLNTNTTLFEDHHAAKAVGIIAGFVGESF